MEAVANFYFRDIDVQPIRIQCRADEKFSKILKYLQINIMLIQTIMNLVIMVI